MSIFPNSSVELIELSSSLKNERVVWIDESESSDVDSSVPDPRQIQLINHLPQQQHTFLVVLN